MHNFFYMRTQFKLVLHLNSHLHQYVQTFNFKEESQVFSKQISQIVVSSYQWYFLISIC